MADPILEQDEVIIKKTGVSGATEYRGYGRFSAWLTLTNRRLIVQRLLGTDAAYPLAHVTKASMIDYQPPMALVTLLPIRHLRIDFDNGGALVFRLYEMPAWVEAIEQTRAAAPQLPYSVTPPMPLSPDQNRAGTIWIVVAVLLGIIACTGMLGLIALLIFLNSR